MNNLPNLLCAPSNQIKLLLKNSELIAFACSIGINQQTATKILQMPDFIGFINKMIDKQKDLEKYLISKRNVLLKKHKDSTEELDNLLMIGLSHKDPVELENSHISQLDALDTNILTNWINLASRQKANLAKRGIVCQLDAEYIAVVKFLLEVISSYKDLEL